MTMGGSGSGNMSQGPGQNQTQGGQPTDSSTVYTPAPMPPAQGGTSPGYMPPPSGPPMASPPKSKRSPLLIACGIIVGLLLLCGIGGLLGGFALFNGVMNATQPIATSGETFMTALRDGDYNKAYGLCTPALQQELKSADDLKAAMTAKQPTSWSFTSRAINNGQGTLSGTTQYKDGSSGTVDLVLAQVGADWKISGASLK